MSSSNWLMTISRNSPMRGMDSNSSTRKLNTEWKGLTAWGMRTNKSPKKLRNRRESGKRLTIIRKMVSISQKEMNKTNNDVIWTHLFFKNFLMHLSMFRLFCLFLISSLILYSLGNSSEIFLKGLLIEIQLTEDLFFMNKNEKLIIERVQEKL